VRNPGYQFTVRLTVVLWLKEPEVAVMVRVYVPVGVPEDRVSPPPPFPPPPQSTKADTSTSAAKATIRRNRARWCPAAMAKSASIMSMSKRSVGSRKPKPGGPKGTEGEQSSAPWW